MGVFVPMVDVYHSMAHKLKEGYRWVLAHFEVSWIMIAFDDFFVRIGELETFLAHRRPQEPTVIGNIIYGGDVQRWGKWQESTYKPNRYPPFPLGSHGYAVTSDVAKFVVEHNGFEYQADDTSLGIWLYEANFPVR